MMAAKSLSFIGEDLDTKVLQIYKEILGDKEYEKIQDFISFYKITIEIENDKLKILQFFHKDQKWQEIYCFNLKTKQILNKIEKSKLLKELYDENSIIIQNAEDELKRAANIIIALLSLIIGAVVALIFLNIN
ncbi:hypothetical protein [Persephonella sp. IF05-L8]|uniref:hypothetical protein n=1 Tax=Persephonella sp. IF05-L8 TaxID=1158338 RepID=UPI00049740D1